MKKLILLGVMVVFTISLSLAQSSSGKAEVFVEIPQRGYFRIYLDDELVGSANGRFRFYEVYNYRPTLSIMYGKERVFSKVITVKPNTRQIFSFSERAGLRLIAELNIYRNNVYALNDFDGYLEPYNTGIVPPKYPNSPQGSNNFETLLATVKKEAFDDNKLKVIEAYGNYNDLTTKQLTLLFGQLSKDDNKLLLAKIAYQYVIDPQLYYTLKDSFTFINTKDEFVKFLQTQKGNSSRLRAMSDAEFSEFRQRFEKEAFDDKKIEFAQVALASTSLNTNQVKSLMASLSFEDKALAFAKWAFRSTADKANYYTVADVLKFPSNRKELLDFIANQK